jgi:NhaP-type Na+/H+ or K+/H+ antiporter
LPPILFNSGYELQRELFFRHFRAIVSFAVVGTIVSGFATGFILFGLEKLNWFGEDFNPSILELLTFGALIAATDTVSVLGVLKSKNVDPHLFNLVFGESALNDAVALVLFRALSKVLISDAKNGYYILHEVQVFFFEFLKICFGSPALGIVFSFIAALVFKRMDLREQKNVELCLYILLVYIPYMLAEVFHLSGIVTIFFTGMSARRYIEPNLSPETAHHAESIFKALAYLAETAIFLELGLTSFGQISGFQWKFAVLAFLASLVGRALSIYPISAFYNWSLRVAVDIIANDDGDSSVDSNGTSCSGSTGSFRRRCYKTPKRRLDREIPNKFMHVLWFAGLRGAIAYACARSFPDVYGNKDGFVSTTMFIVLVSVVVMGGLCDSLLEFLKIRMNVDEKEYMKLWRKQRKLTGAFHDYGKMRTA